MTGTPPDLDALVGFGPLDGGVLPFTVDGQQYALDVPYDGRVLAGWAVAGQWTEIVPGAVHPYYRDEFFDRLADPRDALGLRACHHIALGLAEEIYGVPWWAAERLCATALSSWRYFGAWAAQHNFDPASAPAHRLVSATLAWLGSQVQDEKEARRIEQDVFMPPKPQRKSRMKSVPGFTPAEQAASFEATLAALGGGG